MDVRQRRAGKFNGKFGKRDRAKGRRGGGMLLLRKSMFLKIFYIVSYFARIPI
jgi:hypothetical protein